MRRYFFLLLILVLAGCRGDSRVYEFSELTSDSAIVGKDIKVRTFMAKGEDVCEQKVCPAANPCCRTCTAHVLLTDSARVKIRTDYVCSGTNCALSCQFEEDLVYVVE